MPLKRRQPSADKCPGRSTSSREWNGFRHSVTRHWSTPERTTPTNLGGSGRTGPGFQVFWGAPAVVIISGPVGDCCRAGQNLMLSAHARGLGTCWVGSPMLWVRTASAKARLRIPAELTPACTFCLGYPAAIPEAPPRERPTITWLP